MSTAQMKIQHIVANTTYVYTYNIHASTYNLNDSLNPYMLLLG